MKKTVIAITAVSIFSELLVAGGYIDPTLSAPVFTQAPYKYVKKSITIDDGSVHGYLRMHHIFTGEDNGFDKETGSTLGFGVGYGLEVFDGFKIGFEAYGVMDSGLTDTDKSSIAYGQFMNTYKDSKKLDAGGAWGVHIKYEIKDVVKAIIGRSQFDSPMTKTQITHVPNLYEYARVDGYVFGGNISASFITKMSYGSRSAADFGLIGEKTGTSGMQITPFTNSKVELSRGTFYNIDETVNQTNSSSGIFVLGYETKIRRVKLRIWDFYVDDIANNLYIDATYKRPLGKGKVFKLSAQVWNQSVLNTTLDKTYGGTMYGAEALLKWGNIIAKAAYTIKDEGGLLNAWGSNPGYTSSIFSRNEYRGEVNAYKATLVYKPFKKLKIMASYANYGKSKGFTLSKQSPTSDASEMDLVVVYKPWKQVTFKLFNAIRTSEFDGIVSKGKTIAKTQNQIRLIMTYAF